MKAEIQKAVSVLLSQRPESHDLWGDNELNCSDAAMKQVKKIKKKGIAKLSAKDIDFLTFSSAYTVGSKKTFQYFLPVFFTKFFDNPDQGFTTDPQHIFEKLYYCHFENWPMESQSAALYLARVAAEQEQAEHVDCFEKPDEEISTLIDKIDEQIEERTAS